MKGYRLTTEQFIEKSKIIHYDKYDYSKVNYKSSTDKIDIICKKHGLFSQRASNHLLGIGCKKCNQKIPINPVITTTDFINKAINIHGNKYDYSLVEYINQRTKIYIKCKNNHIFDQLPSSHLNGHGCKYCTDNFNKNTELFIQKANEVHNYLYDYSLVDYKYNSIKVKIICRTHGIFEQRPNNHITLKRGCPNCRTSKNEILISELLKNNNIKFEKQKNFDGCKYKYKLSFDFYLPDFNLCIEYDGKQHYEDIYNCEEEFNNIKLRDCIKNKFCCDNNIDMLRIKYDENVDDKINLLLNKLNIEK